MDSGCGAEAEESLLPDKEADAEADGWWRPEKMIDLAEARDQIVLALPMLLANLAYSLIPLVSIMYAGHIGQLELAGSNLADSWAAISGFDFMVGLSGALETLCGQAFGAKMYRMLGEYLQASSIISIVLAVAVSILWWHSEIVLTSLHQDPQIAKLTVVYLKYLIPGLFAYGLLQNLLRFLQTQNVVAPLLICSIVPLAMHFPIAYALVNWTTLRYSGAALACSISLWISVLMLGLYVVNSEGFVLTWQGFSWECLSHVGEALKLALPSAAMACLEDWAPEILILLSGLMPNAAATQSLVSICANTQSIAYMIASGVSAAASTRVANELGAGNPERARRAAAVTLKLTAFLAVFVLLALSLGHNLWVGFFTDSPAIISAFASMTPLLITSILCDFIQGIFSGVARGCGWQNSVVFVNLGTYYLIGIPVAVLLGFKFKLHAKGLWIGLVSGLGAQTVCLFLLSKFAKWA